MSKLMEIGKVRQLSVYLQAKPTSAVTKAYPAGDHGYHLETVQGCGRLFPVHTLLQAGGSVADLRKLVHNNCLLIRGFFYPGQGKAVVLREYNSLADEDDNVVLEYFLLPQ